MNFRKLAVRMLLPSTIRSAPPSHWLNSPLPFANSPLRIAYPSLKHLPEPAQLLLLSFFNRSWSYHTFPSCWKPTTIIPIHKPGKHTSSPSSFRPISLTSCISKLFEHLILSRLTFHLELNHLLHLPISGRVDRASATEAVDLGSIPGRVKPKTIEIGIHSFPA